MRAPDMPTSPARATASARAAAAEQDSSLRQVSDRFASLFYRRLLESMMDTVPGREDRSGISGAGWTFMNRYLPRALSRGKNEAVGRYIHDSLRSRTGGQVNARM